MDAEAHHPEGEQGQQPELGSPSMFDVSAGAAGSLPSQMHSEPVRHHEPRETPELPESLAVLLTLPGVPRKLFDGVDTDTAWIRAHQMGAEVLIPLAHLAPNAIDTLAEIGFTGQVRAEIRESEKGAVLRYFAFKLPEADLPPMAPEAAAQAAFERRFDRLEDALQRVAEALAAQAQRPAPAAAGLDLSSLHQVLGLIPALKKAGVQIKDLAGMFGSEEDAAPAVSGEDQAQVLGAIFGGLRQLLDSETGQLVIDAIFKRKRAAVHAGPGASHAG